MISVYTMSIDISIDVTLCIYYDRYYIYSIIHGCILYAYIYIVLFHSMSVMCI